MLFSTPTQFAVLVLVLIAGWLLGLASHPGGRKWKDRYAAEREAHAATRRDADTRIAAADARVTEAERVQAAPVVERDLAVGTRTETVTTRPEAVATRPVTEPVATRPAALSAARPAYPTGERRGWFDWEGRRPVR
jgi:hypothetical protein